VAGNHCSFGKNILYLAKTGSGVIARAHAAGAGLPSRNAVCLADNSRYHFRLLETTDKTGQDGHLEDGKGNLTMINTRASSRIGGGEIHAAWIICLISLLISLGFALVRFLPRHEM
jgi:hypothetical protein